MFDFRDTFYDVEYISLQRAVIVGARGRILVSHPKYKNLWSPRESHTRNLLTCLSFVDDKNGWAAGHGGVVIHTKDGGDTWETQRQSAVENEPILDIQFVSTDIGYACGAYDTLIKTTDGGRTWKSQPSGIDNIYSSLYFSDADSGYVVGEFGTLLKTTDGGDSWEQLDIGGYEGSLFGIHVLSSDRILLFGLKGNLMLSEDGCQSFRKISIEAQEPLFRAASKGDEVVIVGRSGAILKSKDNAKSFSLTTDEDLTSFAGVCSVPGGGFLIVGELGKISKIGISE